MRTHAWKLVDACGDFSLLSHQKSQKVKKKTVNVPRITFAVPAPLVERDHSIEEEREVIGLELFIKCCREIKLDLRRRDTNKAKFCNTYKHMFACMYFQLNFSNENWYTLGYNHTYYVQIKQIFANL